VYRRTLLPLLRRLDFPRTANDQLAQLRDRVNVLEQALTADQDTRQYSATLTERMRVNEINQTLIKGEFRRLLATVEDLGWAIAPGAGIGAAGARISEQREQVWSLDRRLRILDARVNRDRAASPAAERPPAQSPAVVQMHDVEAPFDYVGFERRFRGEPEAVLAIQRDRYVPLLSEHEPVVDIGCGRGELLDALAANGTEVIGVEPEPGMAAEARARGVRVDETDAISFLRSVEPCSLGAIFSAHVVEHIQLDYLLEFIHLSLTRLKPGGIFVAETPNPASLIVLGNSYVLDPTHVRPLHPSLMGFLCENAGFRDVRLNFYSPATGYLLPHVDRSTGDLAAAVGDGFDRLNEVLFGPQEYTVVATRGPA
jgi:SAM-dependent methyltransferase